MTASRIGLRRGIGIFVCAGIIVLVAAFAGLFRAAPLEASVGESFLAIPGMADGNRAHRGWIRVEAHYWPSEDADIFQGRNRPRRDKLYFLGPPAPATGPGTLVISIDKRNPQLRRVLAACAAKAELPGMRFSESSDRARGLSELGERPASIPESFEYQLGQVTFSQCPQVDGAPEQAIVLSFKTIAMLNYSGPYAGLKLELEPAKLAPIASLGQTRAFVISWYGVANDVSPGQCQVINAKPTENDFFALRTPEETARIRGELAAKKTSVSYEDEQMAHRGPLGLNAGLLPGIVRDPGHVVPQISIARGMDLDGDDGSGRPPAGICRHRNYLSDDGRKGIDNQLFTVQGCVPGYMGHKGFLMQYRNEQRRNGLLSIMVIISGIDNDRDDDSVDVTLAYSRDPMAKSSNGALILHDYTYRLASQPEYTHYFMRLHGRMENGVVTTDPVDRLQIHGGIDALVTLYQGRLRLRIMPDGSLKGIAAGYEDWRRLMMLNTNSRAESLYGYQSPGMYQALKRSADGLKDPETGECRGISAAYDLEGSPAFIPPEDIQKYFTPSGQTIAGR